MARYLHPRYALRIPYALVLGRLGVERIRIQDIGCTFFAASKGGLNLTSRFRSSSTLLHLLLQLSGRPKALPVSHPCTRKARCRGGIGTSSVRVVDLCDKRVCGRGLQISATTELPLELEAQAHRDIASASATGMFFRSDGNLPSLCPFAPDPFDRIEPGVALWEHQADVSRVPALAESHEPAVPTAMAGRK
jgi:hypothetical protein